MKQTYVNPTVNVTNGPRRVSARKMLLKKDETWGKPMASAFTNRPASWATPNGTRDSSQRRGVGAVRLSRRRRYILSSFQRLILAAVFLVFALNLEHPCYFVSNGTHGLVAHAATCDTADPSSSGSFRQAQQVFVSPDTTTGDIVDLATVFDCEDGNFEVSWSGVVNVSSTITIGRGTTVTIIGNTTTTDISSSSSLSREQATITGSLTSTAVGPRQQHYSNGTLSKDDDQVVSFGPMFYVDGGQLFLERLVIRDCFTANSTSSSLEVHGGGIHAIDSNVTVTACEFENNFAEALGGGIHANQSTLIVVNTTFRGNQAGFQSISGEEDVNGEGGAIGVSYRYVCTIECLRKK